MCGEQKVVTTLGELKAEVDTFTDQCIVTTDDLKEQFVSGVRSSRTFLEESLTRTLNELDTEAEGIAGHSNAAVNAINSVRDTVLTSLAQERAAS